MSETKNSKRIVRNTVFLYCRMLFVMLVSLFTSRMVLQTLGVTDYGIYNVVGGIVLMLSFFISSLSNATQRFIGISLGNDDQKVTEKAFRQSLTLMGLMAVVLLVIGDTVGLWFVCNELVIPPERMYAAVWVYQFSLLSTVAALFQVSFMGLVISYERMNVYAYLGVFEAFVRVVIVCILMWNTALDSLILYAGLMSLLSVMSCVIYAVYCVRFFPTCRIRWFWDKELVRQMLKFVSYNLFGCLSWSAGVTGTNILLNMFFGPAVNAARAISVQVSTIIIQFMDSITTATKPQVIRSYAGGNYDYMLELIIRSSKYIFFLASVLAIPIMFEIEVLLKLWLGNVPEYTVAFTRLMLAVSLVETFFPLLWVAANATGNIKRSQVYGRLITLAILPVSYFMLRMKADPTLPFVVTIVAEIAYWMYSFYDIHLQLDLQWKNYFQGVIRPSLLFLVGLVLMGSCVTLVFPADSLPRLIVMAVTTLLFAPALLYFLLDAGERRSISQFINKKMNLR